MEATTFDRMTSSASSSSSSSSSTSSITSSSSVEDPEAKRNNNAELSLLTEEKLEEDELLVGGAAAPPPSTESVLPSLSEQGLLTPTRGRAFRFAAPSSNDLAESDLEVVQMLASYTEGQLAEKMKQLQSWAYSLGLQEGLFVNSFSVCSFLCFVFVFCYDFFVFFLLCWPVVRFLYRRPRVRTRTSVECVGEKRLHNSREHQQPQ
ncbi:hypothetical protein QOT17_005930 [Balamuthia mandrillaris]